MLHLLHPALVHVSVAFLVVGCLVESWGWLGRREPWARFGGRLVAIGAISLVPTVAAGYLAANTVDVPSAAMATLGAHERNAWILLALVGAALFWKAWGRGVPAPAARVPYALLLAAIAAWTVWTALLGGEMVYVHGVGVGVG